jgi:Tesmin/TSO1-like CXC domain, cysteine-rich domain
MTRRGTRTAHSHSAHFSILWSHFFDHKSSLDLHLILAVSPTKQATSIFSLVEEMLDVTTSSTEKPCKIEIRPRSNKSPEQVCPSMESTSPSVRKLDQHHRLPRENTEPLISPKSSSMEQKGSINNVVRTRVPAMVVTVDSKAPDNSAMELYPIPSHESMINSRIQRAHHHRSHAPNKSRHRSTAFPESCLLQATTSRSFDFGSLPAPPSLVSQVSSKCFLLGQPLIQSPAPMAFRSANGKPGSMVSRMMSNMTPLSENSFHPAMFSLDSTVSDRMSYSDSRSVVDGSFYSKKSVNSIVSASGQGHEPITVERGKAIPSPPLTIRNSSSVRGCGGESSFSGSIENPSQQIASSSQCRPRLYADKMVAFLAVKKARGDDDCDDDVGTLVCTCPKSKCLKLYCVCFQRARLCDESYCKCTNCKNTVKHNGPSGARTIAMANISKRRQDAFQKRKKQTGLGCSCKRNKCLKKYCACYSEGTSCDDSKCECVNCHNMARPLSSFTQSPLSMGSEICPV